MINKEEALICMNRFRNQLHINNILLLDNCDKEKRIEETKQYLLDRYYQEDNRLNHQEMVDLLKLFLSVCSVQDSINEESYGSKEVCFMDTLIHPHTVELIEKAKKVYLPEYYNSEAGDKE